jgi:lipoyl(octanoyl) transferase
VPVVRVSRGGDVTVHGPGQLVVYPIVRLPRGVVDFVEGIGGAIAAELSARGADSRFRRDPVGVWAGARKIAACGLHLRRRVPVHGFAVNIADSCLPLFELVVPCGLRGVVTTTLERESGVAPPPLATIAESLAGRIAHALGRTAEPARERILS